MANKATWRVRGFGAGFLVVGAFLLAAGPAPGAGSGSPADVERLQLPAIRATCPPASPAGGAVGVTCALPSAASSALPREAVSTERALPPLPIAKCEDVPPPSLPLDEPRMTEC
jgi:hypothetical protein